MQAIILVRHQTTRLRKRAQSVCSQKATSHAATKSSTKIGKKKNIHDMDAHSPRSRRRSARSALSALLGTEAELSRLRHLAQSATMWSRRMIMGGDELETAPERSIPLRCNNTQSVHQHESSPCFAARQSEGPQHPVHATVPTKPEQNMGWGKKTGFQ